MRKIVQFVVTDPGTFGRFMMFALCDDGTLWWREPWDKEHERWEKCLAIPQDEGGK